MIIDDLMMTICGRGDVFWYRFMINIHAYVGIIYQVFFFVLHLLMALYVV